MNTVIRKISTGNGDPNQMMHFQVGKQYIINNLEFTISDIVLVNELLEKGIMAYHIYALRDGVRSLWKTIINVPCIIENNISFE